VPLASLADEKSGLTANALRVAAIRGRLRVQKSGQGSWLSSKKWVQEYQKNKYSEAELQRRFTVKACRTSSTCRCRTTRQGRAGVSVRWRATP